MLFRWYCLFALSACSVDLEHTHTLSANDGDCTTADTCTACQAVLPTKKHTPSANWSKDDSQHWKVCTNEGCTKLAVEKTNHTPSTDDSNCTTAITCSVCCEVTTEAKVHTPSINWNQDETSHWKECTNEGCAKLAEANTIHTPNTDDEDCTTVITCSVCNEVTTEAKEHTPNANWSKDETNHWKECAHLNCTKVLGEKINHTPNADDSDCTTAITCSACNEVTTETIEHTPNANWNTDDSQHWKTCTNIGCTKLAVVMANHTPNTDDSDCSTAVTCSACQVVMTEAKGHVTDTNWSKDETNHWKICTNEGCTTVLGGKTNHTPNTDDSDCSTAIACSACNEITTEAKEHTPNANWSNDESQHWKECTNEGCTKLAVVMANHTPNTDDSDCSTAVTCSACQVVMTERKEHNPSANWNTEESQHWTECANLGCTTVLGAKSNHTPNTDDSDCSTEIICSVCQHITTEAKEHTPKENWNTDESQHWKVCTNDGCTTVLGEQTNHTMRNGSNVCEYCNNIDLSIFTVTDGNLLSCSPGAYTSITIPDSVTRIGFAFSGLGELTSIDIPRSVTVISNNAFEGCSGLMSITLPFVGESKDGTSNTHFGYIFGAGRAVDNDRYVPASLKTVVITGGASIGNSAFYKCRGLTSITIPESVTDISDHAFASCTSLTSITIPNSVTIIGRWAFYECSSLASITFNGTIAQWKAITKGGYWNSNTGNYTVTCTDGTVIK